jgi:hypothetical protein
MYSMSMSDDDDSKTAVSLYLPPIAFVACLVSGLGIFFCLSKFLSLIDLPISLMSYRQKAQLIGCTFGVYIGCRFLWFSATELKISLSKLKILGTKSQFVKGLLITFLITPLGIMMFWFTYQLVSS